ncbi:MAG: PspA/IM30 family protein [Pseudomonadota bacterium]
MGILGRINRVIKSSLNETLEKMIDPSKEVDLLIVEMQESFAKAKEEVASSIATTKRLGMKCTELENEVERWQQRAERAVRVEDDELAKEALRQKLRLEQECQKAKSIRAEEDVYVEQLKDSLHALDLRLKEIQLRKDTIKQRARAVKEGGILGSGGKPFADFNRLEDRIEAIEASAELNDSLDGREAAVEAKFARLEKESSHQNVEDELAELKKRMESTWRINR